MAEVVERIRSDDDDDGLHSEYVHRLDCPRHGPRELTWPGLEGAVGSGLATTFDPQDVVAAESTSRVTTEPGPWLLMSVIALGAGTVARVLDLLSVGRGR